MKISVGRGGFMQLIRIQILGELIVLLSQKAGQFMKGLQNLQQYMEITAKNAAREQLTNFIVRSVMNTEAFYITDAFLFFINSLNYILL
jgi:hypothetical protein